MYSRQKLGETSYIDKDLCLQVQILWSFYLPVYLPVEKKKKKQNKKKQWNSGTHMTQADETDH